MPVPQQAVDSPIEPNVDIVFVCVTQGDITGGSDLNDVTACCEDGNTVTDDVIIPAMTLHDCRTK